MNSGKQGWTEWAEMKPDEQAWMEMNKDDHSEQDRRQMNEQERKWRDELDEWGWTKASWNSWPRNSQDELNETLKMN